MINQCDYKFKDNIEKKIIDEVYQKRSIEQLILKIVSFLHSKGGNIRIGEAEILGVIPHHCEGEPNPKELVKHPDDVFVWDFVYGCA